MKGEKDKENSKKIDEKNKDKKDKKEKKTKKRRISKYIFLIYINIVRRRFRI